MSNSRHFQGLKKRLTPGLKSPSVIQPSAAAPSDGSGDAEASSQGLLAPSKKRPKAARSPSWFGTKPSSAPKEETFLATPYTGRFAFDTSLSDEPIENKDVLVPDELWDDLANIYGHNVPVIDIDYMITQLHSRLMTDMNSPLEKNLLPNISFLIEAYRKAKEEKEASREEKLTAEKELGLVKEEVLSQHEEEKSAWAVKQAEYEEEILRLKKSLDARAMPTTIQFHKGSTESTPSSISSRLGLGRNKKAKQAKEEAFAKNQSFEFSPVEAAYTVSTPKFEAQKKEDLRGGSSKPAKSRPASTLQPTDSSTATARPLSPSNFMRQVSDSVRVAERRDAAGNPQTFSEFHRTLTKGASSTRGQKREGASLDQQKTAPQASDNKPDSEEGSAFSSGPGDFLPGELTDSDADENTKVEVKNKLVQVGDSMRKQKQYDSLRYLAECIAERDQVKPSIAFDQLYQFFHHFDDHTPSASNKPAGDDTKSSTPLQGDKNRPFSFSLGDDPGFPGFQKSPLRQRSHTDPSSNSPTPTPMTFAVQVPATSAPNAEPDIARSYESSEPSTILSVFNDAGEGASAEVAEPETSSNPSTLDVPVDQTVHRADSDASLVTALQQPTPQPDTHNSFFNLSRLHAKRTVVPSSNTDGDNSTHTHAEDTSDVLPPNDPRWLGRIRARTAKSQEAEEAAQAKAAGTAQRLLAQFDVGGSSMDGEGAAGMMRRNVAVRGYRGGGHEKEKQDQNESMEARMANIRDGMARAAALKAAGSRATETSAAAAAAAVAIPSFTVTTPTASEVSGPSTTTASRDNTSAASSPAGTQAGNGKAGKKKRRSKKKKGGKGGAAASSSGTTSKEASEA
ncbi:hypothetical protein K402DRAFT_391997 [Aulographum hederae CBS 113979]|uniref:Uncharacterized protein n=1 Tax=Aulographum hederae CBS 113979 TaxID=1176131 RepID=A0A6G1H4T6_9PEZI|nr:hypothetical protein K402DRAFT_391997 [Aulographum hederae CBS 113979]